MSADPSTRPRPRRGGVTLAVLVDVVRSAWWTRNWIVALVVLLVILAALTATVGQTVLPWGIYAGL